jgi:hypothetical protein
MRLKKRLFVALIAIASTTCAAPGNARSPSKKAMPKKATADKTTAGKTTPDDKRCGTDKDCVWARKSHSPCICLPCRGLALNKKGERNRIRKAKSLDCEVPPTCKPCPKPRPGTKAVCKSTVCEVQQGPPIRSEHKNRECKKNADCTFKPRGGCGCPPCGDRWKKAVNKTYAAWIAKKYAVESCPRHKCAKCSKRLRWLGTEALCIQGQCTTR